jgi:cytoskeletal protein CcmA (bactofilin family)
MTTIGPSLQITGELTSQEDITIHGRINGQIRMQEGSLLIAPKGHVDAEVEGSRVTIHGTLAGNVVAADRIELTATADVTGTLTTTSVVLHDGAIFNGIIDMERPAKGKAAKAPAAVAAQVVAS